MRIQKETVASGRKYRWKILTGVVLGVALFAAVGLFADFQKLFASIGSFRWTYLPAVLALSLVNYFLRFLKWNYMLSILGVKVERSVNIKVWLSGLAFSISPGKVGEIIKSLLLNELSGIPVSRTIPVVVTDRFSDVLALVFLILSGVFAYEYGTDVLIVGTAFILIFFLAVRNRKILDFMAGRMLRRFLKKRLIDSIGETLKVQNMLFSVRYLAVPALLSVVAWFAECLGLYLTLKGFGCDTAGIGISTFIYSFSTLAGAVSMIPGGLIATEGSMTALLSEVFKLASGVDALSATIIIRLCTLWFAVIIGIGGFLTIKKLYRKKAQQSELLG